MHTTVGESEREQKPSERVVESVAELEGVDPTDLVPLFDAVDPDALDALFRLGRSGVDEERVAVDFEYSGYTVTVEGTGSVTVTRDTS